MVNQSVHWCGNGHFNFYCSQCWLRRLQLDHALSLQRFKMDIRNVISIRGGFRFDFAVFNCHKKFKKLFMRFNYMDWWWPPCTVSCSCQVVQQKTVMPQCDYFIVLSNMFCKPTAYRLAMIWELLVITQVNEVSYVYSKLVLGKITPITNA